MQVKLRPSDSPVPFGGEGTGNRGTESVMQAEQETNRLPHTAKMSNNPVRERLFLLCVEISP